MKIVLHVQHTRLVAYSLGRSRCNSIATFHNSEWQNGGEPLELKEPETKEPETKEPDTKESDTKEQDTKEHEPEIKKSDKQEQDRSGVKEFSRFLSLRHDAEIIVLLDLQDEQIHLENIPRVGKRDQKSLLLHHQRKLFGQSQYTSGCVGISNDNSADSRITVTLIGLPANPENHGWLGIIDSLSVKVRSFHWMSLLLFPLAETACTVAHLLLVIARIDAGDDRIIAFRGNQLLISRRLGKLAGPDSVVTDLAPQVSQTVAYLGSMTELTGSAFTVEKEVSTVALGAYSSSEIDNVDLMLKGLGYASVVRIPEARLGEGAAGGTLAPKSVAEALAYSVTKKRAFLYSLISRGERFLQRRIRHVMYAVCIFLVATAAVATAASRQVIAEYQKLSTVASEVEAMATDIRHNNHQPEWSDQYPIDGIRESMVHVAAIDRADNSAPFHFLVSLSRQLTAHPTIELSSVKWLDLGLNADVSNEIGGNNAQNIDGMELSLIHI